MTQTPGVLRQENSEANFITAQRYGDNGDNSSDGTSIGSGKGMCTDIDDRITLTPGVSRPEIIETKKITLTNGVLRRGYSYGNQRDYSKGDDSSGGDVYVNDSCLLMDECNNSVVSDDSFGQSDDVFRTLGVSRPVVTVPENSEDNYGTQVQVRAAQDKQGSEMCEVISDSDEQYIPRIRGGAGPSPPPPEEIEPDYEGSEEDDYFVASGNSNLPGEATGKDDSAAKSNTTERKTRGIRDLSLDDLEDQDVDWWYLEKKCLDLTDVEYQVQDKIERTRRDLDDSHIFCTDVSAMNFIKSPAFTDNSTSVLRLDHQEEDIYYEVIIHVLVEANLSCPVEMYFWYPTMYIKFATVDEGIAAHECLQGCKIPGFDNYCTLTAKYC